MEQVGQLLRGAHSVALDRQVQVHRPLAQQQVPHRAADQVNRRQGREQRQEPLHAGHRPQPFAQSVHQSRTGTPASRMRSLASRTVVCP